MNKRIRTNFYLIFLPLLIGMSSCLETGDEERPGMVVNTDYLYNKVWQVNLFKDDGQDLTLLFHEVFLEFRPNFVFRVTSGCDVTEGEWILSSDSTLLVVRMPNSMEPLNQLADEWVITWLTDTEMRLIEQDNKGDEEFHLSTAPLRAISCQLCNNISKVLTDSIWSITKFAGTENDFTEEARGSYLDFEESGDVTMHVDGNEIQGHWALTDQCSTLVIQWKDGQVYPELYCQLADSWYIHEAGNESVLLENENIAELDLSKGPIPDCQELHKGILNTSWSIDHMSINQDDVSGNFRGTGFTFLEGNQLATEVLVGPAVLGSWLLSGNCDQLSVEIQAGHLKELSRDWSIIDIHDNEITLVYEEGALRMEMTLKKGKPEITQECLEFINFLTEQQWYFSSYTDGEKTPNTLFDGYNISFKDDGDVVVWNNDQEIVGKWFPIRDCTQIVVMIDRESDAGVLAGKWTITDSNYKEISMVYEKMDMNRSIELRRD